MKLLFEKVTCEATSSEITGVTKNEKDEELSTIKTDFFCHNHGLMDSPKTNISVQTKLQLGVSIVKAYFDGQETNYSCT